MIRQIRKKALPKELAGKLASGEAVIYIMVKPEDRVKTRDHEYADMTTYVKCPIIRATDDSIYLALAKEKSPAGSLVTKAMWRGESVDVLLEVASYHEVITLFPDRLHISGGIFEKMLHEYRLDDIANDFAAVWEMSFEASKRLPEKPKGYYTEDVIDFYEMHYDNPALKAL